jgi:hypothetical protein
VETHEVVLSPLTRKIIHAFEARLGLRNCVRVIRVALAGDGEVAAEFVAVTRVGDWIVLKAVVERVHENDEEKGSKRVALTNGAVERKGGGEAVSRANLRVEIGERIRDEIDERLRKTKTTKGAKKREATNRVIGR